MYRIDFIKLGTSNDFTFNFILSTQNTVHIKQTITILNLLGDIDDTMFINHLGYLHLPSNLVRQVGLVSD